jgi:sarcosine oxidase gamma subunit
MSYRLLASYQGKVRTGAHTLLSGHRVDLIKINVEGFEMQVLRGMADYRLGMFT